MYCLQHSGHDIDQTHRWHFIVCNYTLQFRLNIRGDSILRKLNGTRLADTLLTPENASSACSHLYSSIATVFACQCGTLAGSRTAFGFIPIEITMPLHPGMAFSNFVVQPNIFLTKFRNKLNLKSLVVAICEKRCCSCSRGRKNCV